MGEQYHSLRVRHRRQNGNHPPQRAVLSCQKGRIPWVAEPEQSWNHFRSLCFQPDQGDGSRGRASVRGIIAAGHLPAAVPHKSDPVFRAGLCCHGAAGMPAKPGVDILSHKRESLVYVGIPEHGAADGFSFIVSGSVRGKPNFTRHSIYGHHRLLRLRDTRAVW